MTLTLALALSAAPHAAEVVLQNDSFTSEGDVVQPVAQFGEAECAAATFAPDVSYYPFEIVCIEVPVFTEEIYEIAIWEVDGNGKPTYKLDSEAVTLNGSDIGSAQIIFNEVSPEEMELGGDAVYWDNEGDRFAISVCTLEGAGWTLNYMTAADDSLDHPDRNWVYFNNGWYALGDVGGDGDWIIRARINDSSGGSVSGCEGESSTGDGGGDGGGDDGGDDTGDGDGGSGDDGGSDNGDDGGGDDTALGELQLFSITPGEAPEGEAVDLVLLGEGFANDAEARIGGIPITGQTVVSDGTITGRSPTALPAGVHDVEVVQDGDSAFLAAAFIVGDTAVEDKGGCGCGAPLGAAGFAWWLAAAGLVGLRRRE